MFDGLPNFCYVTHPIEEIPVVVEKGRMGYNYGPYSSKEKAHLAEELNLDLGVTKAQIAAMITGSMFGWDVPGANPAAYDEKGILTKIKKSR